MSESSWRSRAITAEYRIDELNDAVSILRKKIAELQAQLNNLQKDEVNDTPENAESDT